MVPGSARVGEGFVVEADATASRARVFAPFGAILIAAFIAFGSHAYLRPLHDLYDLPKEALFGAAGFGSLLILLAGAWMVGQSSRVPWEGWILASFLTLSAVAAVASGANQAEAIDQLRLAVVGAAWWLVGVLAVRSGGALRIVLAGVAAAGLGTAVLGMLQAERTGLWEGPLDHWTTSDGGLGPFARLPRNDGPAATFGHVNFAAEVAALGLVAGVGLFLSCGRAAGGRVRLNATILLASVLAVVPWYLALTGTRAAWIAVPIALLGLWLLLDRRGVDPSVRRRARALTLGGAIGAMLLLLVVDRPGLVAARGDTAPASMRERLLALADTGEGTVQERKVLWANSLALAGDHAIVGVGAGNWKIRYPESSRARLVHDPGRFTLARQPEHAHNDPLQLLAETGLAGFVLMSVFVASGLFRLLRRRDEPAAAAAAAVVAAALLLSLTSYPLQKPVPSAVFFLLLGSGAGLAPAGARRGWIRLAPAATGGLALAVAALAFLCVLGWHGRLQANADYLRSQALVSNAAFHAEDRGALPLTDRELVVAALDAADRAATREPGSYRYQLQRATALRLLGLGDRAADALRRVLALHPGFANAMVMLAGLEQAQGRYADARALLERARRIHPAEPAVLLSLARLHHEAGLTQHAGHLSEAARLYRLAIDAARHAPDARLGLARLLLDEGAPPGEIVKLLAQAELEGSRDGGRLAVCARLYGDPRLGMASGLFGPAGTKTLEVWRRVAEISRHRDEEAVMEVSVEALKLHDAGAAAPPPAPEVARMLAMVEGVLAVRREHLRARYYHARLLELAGQPGRALVEWGNLARAALSVDPQGSEAEWIMREATEAAERLRSQEPPPPAPGGHAP